MTKVSICSVAVQSPFIASLSPNGRSNITATTITTTTSIPNPISSRFLLSRRNVALLLSVGTPVPCLSFPHPAFAFNLGISGPKDWLKEQKKKAIKYLLAPIESSRDILAFAHQLLLAKKSEYEQSDLENLQRLLRSAARDCVPEERSSIVAFQAKTGVEVCTFKLIVKNASSLLDENDLAKVEAEAMLNDLMSSFTLLNGVAKEANIQLVLDSREKIADALKDTLSSLDKLELSIKGCIDV